MKMTRTLKIELLYFPGCPNVGATRENLEKALKAFSDDPLSIEEINIHAPESPEEYRNWPSPSILVNGKDVEGTPETEAAACRIYPGSKGPRSEKILEALEKEKGA